MVSNVGPATMMSFRAYATQCQLVSLRRSSSTLRPSMRFTTPCFAQP